MKIRQWLSVVSVAAISLGLGAVNAQASGIQTRAAGGYTPIGALDSLAFLPGGVPVVYGWAADQDSIGETLEVHVYVDGARGYVLKTGTHSRPDVTAAVGATNAGFVGVLPNQGAGVHTVCAYAINLGGGSNTQIGCRSYGSAATAYSPIGALDSLAFLPGGVPVVYGWAADQDSIGETLAVHVYVDGVRGYVLRTGTHSRPDVTAAVGAPNAGFVGVLPNQGPGGHTVCAYAINIGGGSNTQLGCRSYGGNPTPPPAANPPPVVTPPSDVYYANCSAVRAAGQAPLYRGEPGYRSGLDSDNDGIACEV